MTQEEQHPDEGRRFQDGVSIKLGLLRDDVSEVKAVLKELTAAINRLAIVEERQMQAASALERAFTVLEKLDVRVSSLEALAVTSRQTNDWAGKVIWASIAAASVFVGKKLGLL